MSRHPRVLSSLAAVAVVTTLTVGVTPGQASTSRIVVPTIATYEELAPTILKRKQFASAVGLPKPRGWSASAVQGSADDFLAALTRILTNDRDNRSPYEDLIVGVSDWGDVMTAQTQIESQITISVQNGATLLSRTGSRVVMSSLSQYNRRVVNVWGIHGRWRTEGTCSTEQSKASVKKLTRCASKLQRAQQKRSAPLFAG